MRNRSTPDFVDTISRKRAGIYRYHRSVAAEMKPGSGERRKWRELKFSSRLLEKNTPNKTRWTMLLGVR